VNSGLQVQLEKTEAAAQDTGGWTQAACGLCSTGSEKVSIKSKSISNLSYE